MGAVEPQDPARDGADDVEEEDCATFLKDIYWDAVAEAKQETFVPGSIGKRMPVTALCWDEQLRFGQARPLREGHVKNLMRSLTRYPPVSLLRCLGWDNGSMQHASCACNYCYPLPQTARLCCLGINI